MSKYTRQLKDLVKTLNLLQLHPIDAVSEPEGYKRGYTRQLDSTQDDATTDVEYDEFHQTVMKTAQKIVGVKLEKKIKHEITPGSCGAAGALHLEAKVGDVADAVPAYFLPWDQRGGAVQMTIPRADITNLQATPNLFFTAALSGCSVLFKGTPEHPTIIHAGSGQLPVPRDANQFWSDFIEHLDSHPDPAIRHAKNKRSIKSQATKSQYVTGIEIDSTTHFSGKVKSTQHAVDFKRKLSAHYGDLLEIVDVTPWGAVVGIRNGMDWTFYLQENANITYYPRIKIQQVLEYTSGDPVYLPDKLVRQVGKPRVVSRTMALQSVFPAGAAKAAVTQRWRSLLRSDPLPSAPNAYSHEG